MNTELQYPEECAVCESDACSMCGHRQKRAIAQEQYEAQHRVITYSQITIKSRLTGERWNEIATDERVDEILSSKDYGVVSMAGPVDKDGNVGA